VVSSLAWARAEGRLRRLWARAGLPSLPPGGLGSGGGGRRRSNVARWQIHHRRGDRSTTGIVSAEAERQPPRLGSTQMSSRQVPARRPTEADGRSPEHSVGVISFPSKYLRADRPKRTGEAEIDPPSAGVNTHVFPSRTRAGRRKRMRSGAFRRGDLSKLDHAADAVLGLHQLEAVVDLVEGDPVGDEGVDVDLPLHVEIDELRHAIAAFDASER
jgi:hypothetical protein